MFDLKKFYEKENEKVASSYPSTLLAIKGIFAETKNFNKAQSKKEYYRLFNVLAELILKLADYEVKLDKGCFSKNAFEPLLKENNEFYDELRPDNYPKSYADPAYCVKIFGDKFGQLLCYFYCRYRRYITYALYHKIFKMEEYNRLFIDVFNYMKHDTPEYEPLKELITSSEKKNRTNEFVLQLRESYDKNFKYFRDIVENEDLNDLRYLFMYGHFITDNEFRTAKYLLRYSEDKIKKLSRHIAKAYMNGFIRDEKDISKKSTVSIMFNIGQERIIRQLIKDLKEYNLEALIGNVLSTRVNRQYDYDHRFDASFYLEEEYTNLIIRNYEDALEKCRAILSICAGFIYFDKFGELPFEPKHKEQCPKFTPEQQNLYQRYEHNMMTMSQAYMPRKESSSTLVSFPVPEIGENFEQIFEDILEVNMLDSEKYECIQQKIIDALDQADYVLIKGNNETDIKIKMPEIENPAKETNFLNCVADVNIPVGEVFTTPQLIGTNGILYIEETYLGRLKYINLKLIFKDGYIIDYSCDNFDKKEDNKKYIEENLLFPHKTLPLGEFAIGTNTLAYVIARKHDIANVLPPLITEKMGPHFAIGDTCFVMVEDNPVFNHLDKKEVVARENEKTALRKTDLAQAYTHQHTDITLPYDVVKFITVMTKSGERIDIIKNGRFVLKGTEELNRPFKDLKE